MSSAPLVSVVMGVRGGGGVLGDTLASILTQEGPSFELILIVDGGLDDAAEAALAAVSRATMPRMRVMRRPAEGLTKALIAGCTEATGEYIARIDAGDRMRPGRLARQAALMKDHPHCVLSACATEFCGPEWEPLWIHDGEPPGGGVVPMLRERPEDGLGCDIPHHGATMFRRDAYLAAGGYRADFYYGQDWDLWYRLAEQGDYCLLPAPLYAARLFPGALSMRKWRQQRRVAQCSLGAFVARRRGQDEAQVLARARAIRPGQGVPAWERIGGFWSRGDGAYFIGEALRRKRHPHARRYLAQSVRAAPLQFRAYARLLQNGLGLEWP